MQRAGPGQGGPSLAILVAVGPDDAETGRSLSELAELVEAAGARVVGQIVQHHREPDASLYLGRGKAEELGVAVKAHRADRVVADDELTAVQRRNLEKMVGVGVLDRTQVILDIFAQRARSKEGKLQVELAQLTYLLPRLVGWGQTLSRLGGGIGTRGPGETKLEADRRRIKRRIAELSREIDDVQKHRELQRRSRAALDLPLVAVVGYTNAGKSTLLNALSGSEVSARDRLFETLDPTVRRVYLAQGAQCLMSDTVGFVRKLPTHLVAAFRATLEEVVHAHLLVHVVDASAPDVQRQIEAVFETLEQIGAAARPAVLAFNKIDRADGVVLRGLLSRYPVSVPISALHGTNLDLLKRAVLDMLPDRQQTVDLAIPYARADLIPALYDRGQVIAIDYRPEAIHVRAAVPASLARRLGAFGAAPRGDGDPRHAAFRARRRNALVSSPQGTPQGPMR